MEKGECSKAKIQKYKAEIEKWIVIKKWEAKNREIEKTQCLIRGIREIKKI